MEVRADGLRTARVRGLRAFSGGRSARHGRVDAPGLHETRIVSSGSGRGAANACSDNCTAGEQMPERNAERSGWNALLRLSTRTGCQTASIHSRDGSSPRRPINGCTTSTARVSQSCSCMATPPVPRAPTADPGASVGVSLHVT